MHPVAAQRRAGAVEDEHTRGEGVGRGRGRRSRDDRTELGLAGGEFLELAAAEHQVERHTDIGHKGDREEPGEGVARLLALAHEAGESEESQQKARNGEQVREQAVGDRVLDERVVISFQRLHHWKKIARSGPITQAAARLVE